MKFLAAPVGFFKGDAGLIFAVATRFEGALLRRTNNLGVSVDCPAQVCG
jgi:hypothetical protein